MPEQPFRLTPEELRLPMRMVTIPSANYIAAISHDNFHQTGEDLNDWARRDPVAAYIAARHVLEPYYRLVGGFDDEMIENMLPRSFATDTLVRFTAHTPEQSTEESGLYQRPQVIAHFIMKAGTEIQI